MDGLENLGTGLLQGYQFGLQQKRLQKADERQAVQDAALAKSQELQNRTNEFSLQAAQTKQGWSEQDHLKSQKLNQSLNQVIALKTGGDIEGAFKTLTAANNDPAFGSPYKTEYVGLIDGKDPDTGKPAKLGKIRYINNADGTVMGEADLPIEKATVMFAHTHDPVAAMDKELSAKDAAAAKAADRKNAVTDAITLDDHKTQNEIKVERVKAEAARKKAFAELGIKEGALSSTGLKPFTISEVVGKDSFGEDLRRERIDTNQLGRFVRWAEANRIQANDVGSQKWIAAGSPDVDGAPKSDSGAKADTNDLPLPKGLDEPSKDFLSSDVVLPAAKESGVKPSPKTEKPKSEPHKAGKGNAGSKSPEEYVQSLVNALPVMPPPKTYPKGTTFFSRDAGNPLDRTQKVGTR